MKVVDLRPHRRVLLWNPDLHVGRNLGLYVVQFDDCIKIGRSQDLRGRLRTHVLTGARRAHVFPLSSPKSHALLSAEYSALQAIGEVGRRRGRTERFDDLPFDTAVAITADAAARHGGSGPFEANMIRLLELPVQLVPIINREDTK